MANFITKGFSILKEQPIGCFFAAFLSLALISSVVAGIVFIAAAIIAVPVIKDTISAQTGYHATVESVFLNVYTGTCELNFLTLQNPSTYNVSDIVKNSDMETATFMEAKKVKLVLSPYELIVNGKFLIKSAEIDIDVINCVRINSASYNLPEFLSRLAKITEIQKLADKPALENISIKIKRATYHDITTISDIMKWNTILTFDFNKTDVSDLHQLQEDFIEALNNANAPFISRGITF